MIPQSTIARSAASALVIAAYLALTASAVGCGSDDNTTSTATAVASFAPDTATPAAGSITLLPGATSGTSVNVRVTVTEVPNFFGAAFRIAYDPTALLFNGMDDSNSFLRAGVTDPDQLFFDANATGSTGEVVVTATRVFPAVPIAVTATSDLVVFNFVARVPIPVEAEAGRLDFGDPKQVCDGTVVGTGCGAITVTWSGGAVSAQ